MTVAELIKRLSEFRPDMEVMILDGFNGGGHPREINLGPTTRVITPVDDDQCADCEGRTGEFVITMGYGSY